jgi:O-antigen/teichoic acid export membrane protein
VLWLVLVEDQGLRGVYLGGLFAAPVPLVVAWWFVRRTLALDFSRPQLRLMLAYALPLLPVAAAAWVMQFADRFFILHYADAAEVGLYGVAVRLTNVLMLAVIALGTAWSPFILDLHSRDVAVERAVRARAFVAVGVVLGFGAVCLGVWSREFFRTITDASFEDAYKPVGLLLGAVVALGLNGVTMTAISITRRTGYFARYAAYTSIVNIALNFLLIPPFGMVGAAGASFATALVLALLYYRRAQLLDRAPFDLRAVLGALALAAALIAVGSSISLENVWLSILVKLPLVLLYPLVVWRLGWFRLSAPLFRQPARA